jgi:DNA invertase Pin-like site-specific DNA recombinase
MRTTKRAWSYIRFSHKSQAKGDSLRRQLEWGPQICAAKGWTLDETLNLIDLGVSAFRGKNATQGALAGFLEAIKLGKVKPGDVLLLESVDRLSRADIDTAWELFRSILKAGVEIHTREPDDHYLPADLKDFATRVKVQAYLLRAANESETKSMRGVSYWKQARENRIARGKPVNGAIPAWLALSADRQSFVLKPEAVRAVRLIYQWAGEGMGLNTITAKLNREGIPPIGRAKHWARSYVAKLTRDRAVTGEYRPHKMVDGKRVPTGEVYPNHFPAIIDRNEWDRVRGAIKERGKTRGKAGLGISNLFTGLLFDARDGEKFHMEYAGSSRANNCRVLTNYAARCGKPGAFAKSFPYDAFEIIFLKTVRELHEADITDGSQRTPEGDILALESRLADLDKRIHKVQERVRQQPDIDALLDTLTKLAEDRRDTLTEFERLRQDVAQRQPGTLGEVQSLIDKLRAATATLADKRQKASRAEVEEWREIRTRIKGRIRQLLTEIWVLIWDVNPNVRAAEFHVLFRAGRMRTFLLGWLRRGHGRGAWTGIGLDLADRAEDRECFRLLSEYRSSKEVRQWFAQHQENLAVAIPKALDAEVKFREAWGDKAWAPWREPKHGAKLKDELL